MNIVAANAPAPNDPGWRGRSESGSAKIVGPSHCQVFVWTNSVGNEVHGLKLLGNGVRIRLQIKLGAERATNNRGCGVQICTQREYHENPYAF